MCCYECDFTLSFYTQSAVANHTYLNKDYYIYPFLYFRLFREIVDYLRKKIFGKYWSPGNSNTAFSRFSLFRLSLCVPLHHREQVSASSSSGPRAQPNASAKSGGEKSLKSSFPLEKEKNILTRVVLCGRVDPDVCGGVPVRQQVEVHGAVAGGGAVRAGEADKQLE